MDEELNLWTKLRTQWNNVREIATNFVTDAKVLMPPVLVTFASATLSTTSATKLSSTLPTNYY